MRCLSVNSAEAEKIARNESLFREVNERIAETTSRLGSRDARFICECPDPTCSERIELTMEEYEDVRRDGTTFLIVPGHEDKRAESVVEVKDDHAVVEKDHPLVAPLVLALDPRAAEA